MYVLVPIEFPLDVINAAVVDKTIDADTLRAHALAALRRTIREDRLPD